MDFLLINLGKCNIIILPYKKYIKNKKRKIGILKNKASCQIKKDFEITDNEIFKI